MSESPPPSSPSGAGDTRNLPIPVPRPGDITRFHGESWVGRMLRALFGWRAGTLRAGLEVVLDETESDESDFSPEERTLLRNILGVRERRVADVMVPRADIIAVKQDISLAELLVVFEGAAHSRLVVYDETLDDPIGIVHIRDLIGFMTARAKVDPEANAKRKKPFPAGLDLRTVNLAGSLADARIVRKLLFVPPSMPALDLLAKMQATRIHLALVVDEYGGTDGLVSIEDLVEQIVGDIDDEHDSTAAPSILSQPDGSYIADARASLEDVTATIGEDFVTGDAAEDVDTLGGYLVAQVGRLPLRGELIAGPGRFEIEVLDADPRRVKRLRIRIRKEKPAPRVRETRRRDAATDLPSNPADTPSAEPTDTPSATPSDTPPAPTTGLP